MCKLGLLFIKDSFFWIIEKRLYGDSCFKNVQEAVPQSIHETEKSIKPFEYSIYKKNSITLHQNI